MTNQEYFSDSLQHRYLTPAGSPPERFPEDEENTGEANDEEDFDEDEDVDEDEEEEDEDLDEE
jgi:hypothetical protein